MKEESKSSFPFWTYAVKGAVMGIFALVIKLISSFSAIAVYSQDGIVVDLPDFAADIAIFVASLIIYNSVFNLFFSFDKSAAKEYFYSEASLGEASEFKRTFFCKPFLAEIIPALLILSIASACGASWEIFGMFHTAEGKSPYSSGPLPFLATLALVFLILAYERYEAVRYFKILKKQSALEELESKSKIILRVILIFAYPLVLPYLPLVAYLFISSANIITALLAAPVLILSILAIIAAIIGIKLLISIKNRRAFFKKLKTLVRQNSFTLSEIQNPYASLFSRKKNCTFTVKTKKGSFDCLVIGNLNASVPICFTSNSEGYYRYRLGTAKHNVTMQKHFEYTAPGENRKIMIINPTPKYAYICDPECKKEKRLYNSDKLWNYVAYEGEAFLGALDRGSLGKSTSVREETVDVSVPLRLM